MKTPEDIVRGLRRSDAQQLAARENWGIYILSGWQRTIRHLSGVVPVRTYKMLDALIEQAIYEIKSEQYRRRKK